MQRAYVAEASPPAAVIPAAYQEAVKQAQSAGVRSRSSSRGNEAEAVTATSRHLPISRPSAEAPRSVQQVLKFDDDVSIKQLLRQQEAAGSEPEEEDGDDFNLFANAEYVSSQ